MPIFKATARPMVMRKSTTSMMDEHISISTTQASEKPVISARGRSLGIRSLPSANTLPNSLSWACIAGRSSSRMFIPCRIGYSSGRYLVISVLMLVWGICKAHSTASTRTEQNSTTL